MKSQPLTLSRVPGTHVLFFEVPADKLLHGNLPLAASHPTHARHQCFLQAACRVILSTHFRAPPLVIAKAQGLGLICSLLGKGGYIPQCPQAHMAYDTHQITVKRMKILSTWAAFLVM